MGAGRARERAAGPERTLACLELAVLLVTTPAGPVAALLDRGHEHHTGPALSRIAFPELPRMERSELILPDGGRTAPTTGFGRAWLESGSDSRA